MSRWKKKERNRWKKNRAAAAGLAGSLFITAFCGFLPQHVFAEETQDAVIEIASAEDLIVLSGQCSYDSYSLGKTIRLTADIDLTDQEFSGIPYFSGTFDGGSHTISGVDLEEKGSNVGFFRYLGTNAFVSDLNISGSVHVTGSQNNIGGIAGVNYGTIRNSSFSGSVNGDIAVGAIAGANKSGAQIVGTSSDAEVSATNQTGGITGNNEGLIDKCTSASRVNTQELDTTLDIGGVDLGTLNLTQNIVDRNDMGGIAGTSNGVIADCINTGTIGYKHTGYNVGGIAGSQKGKVLSCTNEGEVYGRKDVGGIVGQAEPYVESEYLKDRVDQVQDSVNSISTTLNGLSSSVSSASADVNAYAENITNQYKQAADALSDSLNELSDSMQDTSPQTQEYFDNIENAMNQMKDIQGDDKILSDDQKNAIEDQWQIVRDNLKNVTDSMADSSETAEDFVNDISGKLNAGNVTSDIQGMADTVDREMQTIADSIDSISAQIGSISDTVSDTMGMVSSDESPIEDISSANQAENTDGVISQSTNRGTVHGDLNVGGIAGTMNIEYDVDPEYDLDLKDSTNVRLRSTVNDVVTHCINYGQITSKKDCAGGITGMQELGLIYASEGYGNISSDTGDYAGGITGNSVSAISNSYSLCNVESKNNTGGIAGSGYTVKNCIAIASVSGDGEAKGSLAGTVDEEGDVTGNFFVSDTLGGIDNINYSGVADRTSYEEIMARDGIPEGFHKLTITFKADDSVIETKTIAYNGSFGEGDLPEIPEKDGYYAEWPKDLVGHAITKNETVEADYHLWTESIAGDEKTDNDKSYFLIEGKFYAEDTISMQTCDLDGLHGNVEYAYEWKLNKKDGKKPDTVTGHFYVKDTSGSNEVWYRRKDETDWQKAQTALSGSYLVADIPCNADFAVLHKDMDNSRYTMLAVAAIGVFLAALFLRKRRKKAKKK